MPKLPHICIFSALYYPHTGGVETFTKGLSSSLAAKGLNTTIVTMNTDSAPSREIIDGVEIIRLPCLNLIRGRYPLPKHDKKYREEWQELESLDITHVIINTRFYPLSILGASFASKRGIKPIVIEHGSAYLTLGNAALDSVLHIIEDLITKAILRYSPDFYGISKKASDWLSHFGIQSKGEINNAIDPASFVSNASNRDFRKELSIEEDTLLVAYAGRLVPEKGIAELAQAATLLSKNEGDGKGAIAIALAGDGPLAESLPDDTPTIVPLGKLARSDLAALLLQSDVCCLPSRSEGFSTFLLEAAVCGTPPIATDVGGMREIAPDASYGIRLESMDSTCIANAIIAANSNRDTLRKMGSNVKARAEATFTWEESAKKVLEALDLAK